MLKKNGTKYIDEEVGITIRLLAGGNPTTEVRECGVGTFIDKKNSVFFDFDTVELEKELPFPVNGFSKVCIIYLFPDLISEQYWVRAQETKPDVKKADVSQFMQSYLDQACALFVESMSNYEPTTIYKFIYVDHKGIVFFNSEDLRTQEKKKFLKNFHSVDTKPLRKRLDNDVAQLVEQSDVR